MFLTAPKAHPLKSANFIFIVVSPSLSPLAVSEVAEKSRILGPQETYDFSGSGLQPQSQFRFAIFSNGGSSSARRLTSPTPCIGHGPWGVGAERHGCTLRIANNLRENPIPQEQRELFWRAFLVTLWDSSLEISRALMDTPALCRRPPPLSWF